MYNSVMQTLDLRVQVVYPIDYLECAMPRESPLSACILRTCRQILTSGDEWSHFINDALFHHPRRLAVALFDKAVVLQQQSLQNLEELNLR